MAKTKEPPMSKVERDGLAALDRQIKPLVDEVNAKLAAADAAGVTADDLPEGDAGSMIVTEANGQTTFYADDDKDDAPIAPGALEFDTAEEARKTALALKSFVADLKKTAKSERDVGQLREATSTDRVAAMIEDRLLPQLEDQASLDFDEGESIIELVTQMVGRTTRTAVTRALTFTPSLREGETTDDAKARNLEKIDEFESLIGKIAEHAAAAVMPALQAVAEEAFDAGRWARDSTPEGLALRGVQLARKRQEA